MKVDKKLFAAVIAVISLFPSLGAAKVNVTEITKKNAEAQIRNLIDPLLEKYCRDQCKLLSATVNVDLSTPDEVSPGFEEVHPQSETTIAASSARIKLLIDDKVGPVSRGKLLELLQQYLDTLDYPVKIDTQIAHFPQPIGSESKIAELREKVAKQFQGTINDLIQQFCPDRCLLADFNLATETVNSEESQYGSPGEFVQEGGVALKIKDISGALLIDESLTPQERANIVEMAKLKTSFFRNVSLTSKAMKFPKPGQGDSSIAGGMSGANRGLASEKSENSSSTSSQNSNSQNLMSTTSESKSAESNTKQERFERIEKIERVESGDAIHNELQKFKVYGLIFGCSILSLLVFIAMASLRRRESSGPGTTVHRVLQSLTSDPITQAPVPQADAPSGSLTPSEERSMKLPKRYEIERLIDELSAVFAQHPKVAKQVFSRVLTEEGVEVTAQYIHIFGESVVVEMLRDPSLQSDLNQLMEYYAKTPIEVDDDEKLDLLRRLHNRTVAGKLIVLGNRSSNLFDFLVEMDAVQILEMIRTESLTVKAIVLTQADTQKRGVIYSQLEEDTRMKLLSELSRIDYLPRDYIFNVSNALKRKRRDNPKLNTEALPGSEVLVSLLERTSPQMQRSVVKNLELSNPESARTVKAKLVSIDTLRFLRDGQLLEVVLSLKHEELLQFLKGVAEEIRNAIFAKSPKELVVELEEELMHAPVPSREAYHGLERKILNRMKLMANDGLINLIETNDRMFTENGAESGFVGGAPTTQTGTGSIKKVAGW